MQHKRFRGEIRSVDVAQPQGLVPSPGHFVVYPSGMFPGLSVEQAHWQQGIYRLAFEQAQAAARPSLPERDLLAVWN